MNSIEKKVVTRFAPSPTGFLHIGGVRTAIFSYLYAKKMGGTFILRIEDTDKEREVAGSIEHIMESLRWLNIEWDYGPDKPGTFGSCIQSERLASYKKYALQLIDKGLAYPDPYTKEEVEKFRQDAEAQKKPFLFRNYRPETFDEWDGSKPLRLKVPEVKRYVWEDAVRGQLEAGEEMLDDIVLIKSDGYPTYNFAHIIDDLEMGVTHIMRADEFIASQPKFLSIYDALEIPYPVFVSLPPILRDDRTKKLGKRDGAKDILDYRTEGYLPEAMFNFLTLIGWNPGTEKEVFTKDELINEFDLHRIQKSGGAFNEEKLKWLNKEHLNSLSASKYKELVLKAIPAKYTGLPSFTEDRLEKLMPVIRERTHIMADVTTAFEVCEYDFVFTDPDVSLDILRFKKDPDVHSAAPRLQHLALLLETADFSSPDTIKSAVWDYAEQEGRGEVLWPMRVALTGLERSPDPFTVAYIIGQTDTLRRLQAAYDKIGHAK
ncbi:glutamate--tRNA ligase [Candidatus Nomurabacteria bacterium]|nr:glutamate--tRNA ligase [Candidatus Nomurabacteria bacterium]MCB9819202.1 glutamate--tRNA ligase [Candidatus Nomurabacteria bacterium]